MDTYDIVLTVLAVITYSVIGYRTVRWLRSKPRDWRYAALIITEWASWVGGVTLAYHWPSGDGSQLAATVGLLACFEIHAAADKASDRHAARGKIDKQILEAIKEMS